MRIQRENTTAVIVDVQERLFPHIQNREALTERLEILIRGLRELQIPLIVTEQYRKGLGPTVTPVERAAATGGTLETLEKMAFSCCDDPVIAERLIAPDIRTVMLAGIETHICVLQSSMDLLSHGITPVVVADATGSRRVYDRELALQRIQTAGGVLTTVESVLFELCRYAGTDTFRTISALVK